MVFVIPIIEFDLDIAKLMDIVFINVFGKVYFFHVIEYFIQFIEADIVFMVLYMAVDAVFDFIVVKESVFFPVVTKTVSVFL